MAKKCKNKQKYTENSFDVLHIFALRSTKKRDDELCEA